MTRTRRRYSDALKAECVERMRQGERVADLTRAIGIPQSALTSWRELAGVPSQRTCRYNDTQRAAVVAAVHAGQSMHAVAKRFGVNWRSVESWVQNASAPSAVTFTAPPVPHLDVSALDADVRTPYTSPWLRRLKARVVEAARHGADDIRISEREHIDAEVVRAWCAEAGVAVVERDFRARDPDVMERAVALVEGGLTIAQASKSAHVNHAALLRECVARGVAIPGRVMRRAVA